MTPPGLSLATVSGAAWERSRRSTLPRFYFDWERMLGARDRLDAVHAGRHPGRGAGRRARAAARGGPRCAFARHAALGRACREGMKAMGLELFSPDEERSAIVTAILTPDGVDARELVLALRDRFGITVAGAHGELGSRMFRIGHIGYYDVLESRPRSRPSRCCSSSAVRPSSAASRRPSARGVPRGRSCLSDRRSSFASRSLTPDSSSCAAASTSLRNRVGPRGDHRRVRCDRDALGHDARRGLIERAVRLKASGARESASTTWTSTLRPGAESSSRMPRSRQSFRQRSIRSRFCSRSRGTCHRPTRHSRREAGNGAVTRGRARREDARRSRSRTDRKRGRAPGTRARDACRRLRPVRRARALPRARLEPRRSRTCMPAADVITLHLPLNDETRGTCWEQRRLHGCATECGS